MEVEYELGREDLYAFQWRAAYSSPAARRTRHRSMFYLCLAFTLLLLLPGIGSTGFKVHPITLLILATVLPIMCGAYWLLERWMMRRAILKLVDREKPDKGQLGRHRIVLDESGVVETTAVGESHTTWAGIDRVEQNDDYVFVYTTPSAAHVVPKRAFDQTGLAQFLELTTRVRQP